MARSAGRSPMLVAIIGVCALVVTVLFAAVVRESWTDTAEHANVVHQEEDGAAIMHGMLGMLSDLVEAQSTAVRGEKVNVDAIRNRIKDLTNAQGEYGASLQSDQRLKDLASQLESVFARGETGKGAYDTYTGLVDLTVEMIRRIGDTSHLIHDPDLDSYYLMEAAVIRLPHAIVYAGRAADLVALAGGKPLAGEDAVAAGVARFLVSSDAEQVASGLTKSVDATNRAELGTNIAERLDSFKAAADAFAPPTMLGDLATSVDAGVLAANARKVFAAATSLGHLLLTELQVLLDNRAGDLAQEQRFTGIAGAAAAIVGLVMLWLAIAGRPQRGPTRPFGAPQDLPVGSLAYARELLESQDLASVGRGRSRGSDDAL